MRHAHRYGPWALITGASDGIGKALATQIAAEGINVVLCARSQDKLAALAAELTAAHGIETMVLPADLADPGAAETVENLTSPLDIGLVVLAAGFGTTGSVLETSLAEELQLVAVNITAVMRLSHTFAGRLAARGKGGLVLFGSIVGWQGVPGQANYAASKAYVQSLAEGLHDELAPQPRRLRSRILGRVMPACAAPSSPGPSTPHDPGRRYRPDGFDWQYLAVRGIADPAEYGHGEGYGCFPFPQDFSPSNDTRPTAHVRRGFSPIHASPGGTDLRG